MEAPEPSRSPRPPRRQVAPPPIPALPSPPPVPQHAKPLTILNPEELDRFKNLLIFARKTVDGYFSGKHKSHEYGCSGEFAEFKQYAQGEPVSDIDWRIYARRRSLVVRTYEEETDMAVYLVVDVSGSMRFRGAGLESKSLRAARIAAALAYLMIQQGDKVSLALFTDALRKFLPPGGTRRHLFDVMHELEHLARGNSGLTEVARSLDQCVSLFKKRGRMIVLSDFFGDLDATFEALGKFVHRRFEVLLLQVLDPDELNLPDVSVAHFVDMGTNEQIQVTPDEIRRTYRMNMEKILRYIESRALRNRIQYSVLKTENPYLEAIEAYIGFRRTALL